MHIAEIHNLFHLKSAKKGLKKVRLLGKSVKKCKYIFKLKVTEKKISELNEPNVSNWPQINK